MFPYDENETVKANVYCAKTLTSSLLLRSYVCVYVYGTNLFSTFSVKIIYDYFLDLFIHPAACSLRWHLNRHIHTYIHVQSRRARCSFISLRQSLAKGNNYDGSNNKNIYKLFHVSMHMCAYYNKHIVYVCQPTPQPPSHSTFDTINSWYSSFICACKQNKCCIIENVYTYTLSQSLLCTQHKHKRTTGFKF